MNNMRLSDLTHWVAWKRVGRHSGLLGKMPINPHTGRAADKTNPAHWGTLAQARQRMRCDYLDGVGICLTTADPFVCVDLDNAIVAGAASALAVELMEHFGTYTEYSPSGTGLHIWLKSDEQVNRNMKKLAGIEVYSHACFLTWTGNRYPGTPNRINAGSVSWLVERFSRPKALSADARTYDKVLPVDDTRLWEQIFRYDRTQRLCRLYHGDMSVAGDDHSNAVIITLNTLARYTAGDRQRMRRMMEQTGLPKDKWTSKRGDGDWLDWRIADACAYQSV